MTQRKESTVTLGIYEKALPSTDDWGVFFRNAREAGFSFVDLSIDESAERMERLGWDYRQRQKVREAARQAHIRLGGICLSAHRAVMPGSQDPQMRQRALDLYRKAIDFCVDMGIPVVQVAGYYAYYEPHDPDAAQRYLETLALALPYAEQRGIIPLSKMWMGTTSQLYLTWSKFSNSCPRPGCASTPISATLPNTAGMQPANWQRGKGAWSLCTSKTYFPDNLDGYRWARDASIFRQLSENSRVRTGVAESCSKCGTTTLRTQSRSASPHANILRCS